MDFLKNVPSGFDLRDTQREILEELGESWDDYENFVVDAPVGVGKSLLAVTLALSFNTAHLLTPKKSLQEQYGKSFGNQVQLMAGRANYPCVRDQKIGPRTHDSIFGSIDAGQMPKTFGLPTCADDRVWCISEAMPRDACEEYMASECAFAHALRKAQKSRFVVHNIIGFCYHTAMGDHFDARDLLVVDEAHSMAENLRTAATRTKGVRKKVAEELLKSTRETDRKNVYEFTEDFLNNTLENPPEDDKAGFWVPDNHFYLSPKEGGTDWEITRVPLNTASLARKFVHPYGTKKVFMTGSVGDYNIFLRELGLDSMKTKDVRIRKSPFPVHQRKIYVPLQYANNMAKKHRDGGSWDRTVTGVRTIMDRWPDVRGIIHTPSYEMSRFLADKLGNRAMVPLSAGTHKGLFGRFLTLPKDDNTVFVSPAISEGVDMKYHLARFQIILQLAFLPPLGVYKLMPDGVYQLESRTNVARTLVQQSGRVVRTFDDWGFTYILDNRVVEQLGYAECYPPWFYEAVEVVPKGLEGGVPWNVFKRTLG